MVQIQKVGRSFSEKCISLSFFLSTATTNPWCPPEIICKHANDTHISYEMCFEHLLNVGVVGGYTG